MLFVQVCPMLPRSQQWMITAVYPRPTRHAPQQTLSQPLPATSQPSSPTIASQPHSSTALCPMYVWPSLRRTRGDDGENLGARPVRQGGVCRRLQRCECAAHPLAVSITGQLARLTVVVARPLCTALACHTLSRFPPICMGCCHLGRVWQILTRACRGTQGGLGGVMTLDKAGTLQPMLADALSM
jgi:hypothetical protein